MSASRDDSDRSAARLTASARPLTDALQRSPGADPLPVAQAVALLIADARLLAGAGAGVPRETDPAYMAPEQTTEGDAQPSDAEGSDAGGSDARRIDPCRAALYAWGAMAYTLLAGRHPFASSETADALAMAHRTEAPAPLVLAARDVPHDVATVVMRCLAKDPDERPESAQDVVDALERAAAELSKPPVHATRRRLRFIGNALGMLGAAGAMALASGLLVDRSGATWSVAVLPFEHRGDTTQADVTRALGDAISERLASVHDVVVVDPGSTAEYAATTKTPAEIGAELGVSYLLRGTVDWTRGDDGAWRGEVRSRLVYVRDGREVWRDREREVTPDAASDSEREIARIVLSTIGMQADSAARMVLGAAPAGNPEATALHRRARALLRAPSTNGARDSAQRAAEAVRLLERATSLDSTFARAHGALALLVARDVDTVRYARAVHAALALDSTLPEAHQARAEHLWFVEARFADALAAAERASASRPANAGLLALRGAMRVQMGQIDAGIVELARAATLDPRDARLQAMVAMLAWQARRHDEAERHARRVVTLAPTDPAGHRLLVATYLARDDSTAARRALELADSVFADDARDASLTRLLPRAWASVAPAGDSAGATRTARTARTGSRVRDLLLLGAWHHEAGRDSLARTHFDSARIALPAGDVSLMSAGQRAVALAGAGLTADARRAIAAADSMVRANRPPHDVEGAALQEALAYAALLLGERDVALSRLERVLTLPSGITPALLRVMWPFASLQGDPRFARMVAAGQAAGS